jgi:hypothetical protein
MNEPIKLLEGSLVYIEHQIKLYTKLLRNVDIVAYPEASEYYRTQLSKFVERYKEFDKAILKLKQ